MQRILVLCTLLFCTSLSGCLSTLEQAVDEECSFENKSTNSDTLRILSYDILAFDSEMIEAFEAEFGYEIEFIYENDAGGILNQMMLTKNIPQADLAIGLDNTYIQKAIEFCLLQIEISWCPGHQQRASDLRDRPPMFLTMLTILILLTMIAEPAERQPM